MKTMPHLLSAIAIEVNEHKIVLYSLIFLASYLHNSPRSCWAPRIAFSTHVPCNYILHCHCHHPPALSLSRSQLQQGNASLLRFSIIFLFPKIPLSNRKWKCHLHLVIAKGSDTMAEFLLLIFSVSAWRWQINIWFLTPSHEGECVFLAKSKLT